jgi:hypothetical protein
MSGVAVLLRCEADDDVGQGGGRPTGTGGRAMIVTEEWLFPGRKICYRDFGGDGGGLSKCGHGGESGGGVLCDGLTNAGSGDTKGDCVGGACILAGVAVAGRDESGVVLSG